MLRPATLAVVTLLSLSCPPGVARSIAAQAAQAAQAAAGDPETKQAAPEAGAPGAAADAALRAQLDRALPEASFDGVGFADVIDFLRDVSGANIFVNWRALEAAGIDRNAPITARLRNVKFGKVITIVLDSASGGAKKLDYVADGGVITVSTADDLGKHTITRLYDVGALLEPRGAGAKAADAAAGEGREETLVKLIVGTVAPDSWRDRGGTSGSVRLDAGHLIVTQTPQNHQAVANLLDQTRKLLGVPPAPPATRLELAD